MLNYDHTMTDKVPVTNQKKAPIGRLSYQAYESRITSLLYVL